MPKRRPKSNWGASGAARPIGPAKTEPADNDLAITPDPYRPTGVVYVPREVRLVRCKACMIRVAEEQRLGHLTRCPKLDLGAHFN